MKFSTTGTALKDDNMVYVDDFFQPSANFTNETEKGFLRVFENELQTIYWAEHELMRLYPWLTEEASAEDLKGILRNDLILKKEQYKRLEAIFSSLGLETISRKCDTIEGLIIDVEAKLYEIAREKDVVRDVAIIALVRKIEHYEIASYGTLCSLANVLNLEEVYLLLDSTLKEENGVDGTLSELGNFFMKKGRNVNR